MKNHIELCIIKGNNFPSLSAFQAVQLYFKVVLSSICKQCNHTVTYYLLSHTHISIYSSLYTPKNCSNPYRAITSQILSNFEHRHLLSLFDTCATCSLSPGTSFSTSLTPPTLFCSAHIVVSSTCSFANRRHVLSRRLAAICCHKAAHRKCC